MHLTAQHRMFQTLPIVEEESFTDLTAEIDPEELLVHADRNKAGDWNTLRYTSNSTGTRRQIGRASCRERV